ncbi:hypothetical protein C8Q69DRAFT_85022 [Paecilomyces variotii]|uniref:Uncharacterized protein n=1 Tax=Byssochlamys spectabilis TaxID=264951 RepID=A0A443HLF7_BYSSP|nr:hypothetical protein C8Q69DRAFT_85022 [Paecilomyces variotii]RWQ92635.1 hypothetical protein C8Q69DRAFT_85022 [Paecilomyces variotii]
MGTVNFPATVLLSLSFSLSSFFPFLFFNTSIIICLCCHIRYQIRWQIRCFSFFSFFLPCYYTALFTLLNTIHLIYSITQNPFVNMAFNVKFNISSWGAAGNQNPADKL